MENLKKVKVVKRRTFGVLNKQINFECKKEFQAIDIMKYICAILVILVHASTILPFSPALKYIIVNVLSRVAVPFFFLSSAFFLAKNIQTRGTPYFKKYVVSLCKTYLFWSVLYMPIGIQWLQENMMLEWYLYPIALVIAIFYVGMYYPLWYLPAFITAILVVYLWQKHLRLRWLLLLSFALWCFGALETYYGILPEGPLLTIFKAYIQYFITTRNFLFFALFYVTCGFVVARHDILIKQQLAKVLSIVFLVCLLVEAYCLTKTNALDFNILLFAAPFTLCLFSYLQQVKVRANINLKNLRMLSEYYYYLHGFVLCFVSYLLKTYTLYNFSNIQCLMIIIALTHYLSIVCCMMKDRLGMFSMYQIYKIRLIRKLHRT